MSDIQQKLWDSFEGETVESLRQQLASRDAEIAELRKQVTLLRDVILWVKANVTYSCPMNVHVRLDEALDLERTKPFPGDILEWAERDAPVMRQQLDAANTLITKYREETTSLRQRLNTLQELKQAWHDKFWTQCKETNELRQQLAEEQKKVRFLSPGVPAIIHLTEENDKLLRQVTLLRDAAIRAKNRIQGLSEMLLPEKDKCKYIDDALAASEPKL